jgi:hypothetical protein
MVLNDSSCIAARDKLGQSPFTSLPTWVFNGANGFPIQRKTRGYCLDADIDTVSR